MMSDTPETGPASLGKKVEGLGAPIRMEALVTCAFCREGHAGYCPNDLITEGDACPVGWVADEIERRKLESPDSD
jgi:hypothetical protein